MLGFYISTCHLQHHNRQLCINLEYFNRFECTIQTNTMGHMEHTDNCIISQSK